MCSAGSLHTPSAVFLSCRPQASWSYKAGGPESCVTCPCPHTPKAGRMAWRARSKGQGFLLKLRTQIRWLSFSVLCTNTRQAQGFNGDTRDTLEPLPSTYLAAGTRGMSRFLVGIRELGDAKFSLFRKRTQSRTWESFATLRVLKSPAPRQAVPTPSPGRQNRSPPRTPGPQAPWPGWPRAWKQETL